MLVRRLEWAVPCCLVKMTWKRREIYDFLVKTYNLRNKIVHGPAYTSPGIAEIVSKLKRYLRKSITALL